MIKNKKVFYGNVYNSGYAEVKIRKSQFLNTLGQGYVRYRFTVLGHSGNLLRYCTVNLFWSYGNNLYYSVTQDNGDDYGRINVTEDDNYYICKINNPYCQRLVILNDSDSISSIN